jgi:hypothetical protein
MTILTLISKITNWFKGLNSKMEVTKEPSHEELMKAQEARDLAELSKFENKIRTNVTVQSIDTQNVPEYVDGLSIKNPFVGE